MFKPKLLSRLALAIVIAALLAGAVLGQSDSRPTPEPNYEVLLHVFAGNNDGSRPSDLPAAFGPVVRQLKANFGYTDFRMINTYLGRVANNGNIDYRSVADMLGKTELQDAPTFLEWRLTSVRPNASPATSVQLQGFRFGAKVPVRVAGSTETGKPAAIAYENIGLSVDRLGVPLNMPVLIGTIALPRSDGAVFLVLTLKPTEN